MFQQGAHVSAGFSGSCHAGPAGVAWTSWTIMASTGLAMESGLTSEKCGQTRWCAHCEKLYRWLLSGPHAIVLADSLVAVLGRAMQSWVQYDAGVVWPDFMSPTLQECICFSSPGV